jgi:hypothetical protein
MAKTYEPIATQTLGSSAATVTFSSIPATYTDLVIVSSALSAGSTETVMLRFNGDSGTNYSFTYLIGTGSSAISGRASSVSFAVGGSAIATDAGTNLIQIMNYSNSTTYKTIIDRRGGGNYYTFADVSLWRSTAAITSLTLQPENSQSFASGSVFTLYGIKSA